MSGRSLVGWPSYDLYIKTHDDISIISSARGRMGIASAEVAEEDPDDSGATSTENAQDVYSGLPRVGVAPYGAVESQYINPGAQVWERHLQLEAQGSPMSVPLDHSQQEHLGHALTMDVLAVIHLSPQLVSGIGLPHVTITKVDGDSLDVDVQMHFSTRTPGPPGPLCTCSVARSAHGGDKLPACNAVKGISPQKDPSGHGAHADGDSMDWSCPACGAHRENHQLENPQGHLNRVHSHDFPLATSPLDVQSRRGTVSSEGGGDPLTHALLPLAPAASEVQQWVLREYEINPNKVLLGRRVAAGGFAEVFVGRYEGTNVAVKRLLFKDPPAIERFIEEVVLLARMRHPNLVLFLGYCTTPDLCILTEYLSRGSLYHLLQSQGGKVLEPRVQWHVALSVARGMAYLHSRQPPVLHMDLKSPNILIAKGWRVKIADFGLSHVRQKTYVSSGGFGTPQWMAPEVLRSEPHEEAADVYSYGVLLWELLTGKVPWSHLSPLQVVGVVGFSQHMLPLDHTQGDPVLVELCKACLAMNPKQRPCFEDIVQAVEHHWKTGNGDPHRALAAAGQISAEAPSGGGRASSGMNGAAVRHVREDKVPAVPCHGPDPEQPPEVVDLVAKHEREVPMNESSTNHHDGAGHPSVSRVLPGARPDSLWFPGYGQDLERTGHSVRSTGLTDDVDIQKGHLHQGTGFRRSGGDPLRVIRPLSPFQEWSNQKAIEAVGVVAEHGLQKHMSLERHQSSGSNQLPTGSEARSNEPEPQAQIYLPVCGVSPLVPSKVNAAGGGSTEPAKWTHHGLSCHTTPLPAVGHHLLGDDRGQKDKVVNPSSTPSAPYSLPAPSQVLQAKIHTSMDDTSNLEDVTPPLHVFTPSGVCLQLPQEEKDSATAPVDIQVPGQLQGASPPEGVELSQSLCDDVSTQPSASLWGSVDASRSCSETGTLVPSKEGSTAQEQLATGQMVGSPAGGGGSQFSFPSKDELSFSTPSWTNISGTPEATTSLPAEDTGKDTDMPIPIKSCSSRSMPIYNLEKMQVSPMKIPVAPQYYRCRRSPKGSGKPKLSVHFMSLNDEKVEGLSGEKGSQLPSEDVKQTGPNGQRADEDLESALFIKTGKGHDFRQLTTAEAMEKLQETWARLGNTICGARGPGSSEKSPATPNQKATPFPGFHALPSRQLQEPLSVCSSGLPGVQVPSRPSDHLPGGQRIPRHFLQTQHRRPHQVHALVPHDDAGKKATHSYQAGRFRVTSFRVGELDKAIEQALMKTPVEWQPGSSEAPPPMPSPVVAQQDLAGTQVASDCSPNPLGLDSPGSEPVALSGPAGEYWGPAVAGSPVGRGQVFEVISDHPVLLNMTACTPVPTATACSVPLGDPQCEPSSVESVPGAPVLMTVASPVPVQGDVSREPSASLALGPSGHPADVKSDSHAVCDLALSSCCLMPNPPEWPVATAVQFASRCQEPLQDSRAEVVLTTCIPVPVQLTLQPAALSELAPHPHELVQDKPQVTSGYSWEGPVDNVKGLRPVVEVPATMQSVQIASPGPYPFILEQGTELLSGHNWGQPPKLAGHNQARESSSHLQPPELVSRSVLDPVKRNLAFPVAMKGSDPIHKEDMVASAGNSLDAKILTSVGPREQTRNQQGLTAKIDDDRAALVVGGPGFGGNMQVAREEPSNMDPVVGWCDDMRLSHRLDAAVITSLPQLGDFVGGLLATPPSPPGAVGSCGLPEICLDLMPGQVSVSDLHKSVLGYEHVSGPHTECKSPVASSGLPDLVLSGEQFVAHDLAAYNSQHLLPPGAPDLTLAGETHTTAGDERTPQPNTSGHQAALPCPPVLTQEDLVCISGSSRAEEIPCTAADLLGNFRSASCPLTAESSTSSVGMESTKGSASGLSLANSQKASYRKGRFSITEEPSAGGPNLVVTLTKRRSNEGQGVQMSRAADKSSPTPSRPPAMAGVKSNEKTRSSVTPRHSRSSSTGGAKLTAALPPTSPKGPNIRSPNGLRRPPSYPGTLEERGGMVHGEQGGGPVSRKDSAPAGGIPHQPAVVLSPKLHVPMQGGGRGSVQLEVHHQAVPHSVSVDLLHQADGYCTVTSSPVAAAHQVPSGQLSPEVKSPTRMSDDSSMLWSVYSSSSPGGQHSSLTAHEQLGFHSCLASCISHGQVHSAQSSSPIIAGPLEKVDVGHGLLMPPSGEDAFLAAVTSCPAAELPDARYLSPGGAPGTRSGREQTPRALTGSPVSLSTKCSLDSPVGGPHVDAMGHHIGVLLPPPRRSTDCTASNKSGLSSRWTSCSSLEGCPVTEPVHTPEMRHYHKGRFDVHEAYRQPGIPYSRSQQSLHNHLEEVGEPKWGHGGMPLPDKSSPQQLPLRQSGPTLQADAVGTVSIPAGQRQLVVTNDKGPSELNYKESSSGFCRLPRPASLQLEQASVPVVDKNVHPIETSSEGGDPIHKMTSSEGGDPIHKLVHAVSCGAICQQPTGPTNLALYRVGQSSFNPAATSKRIGRFTVTEGGPVKPRARTPAPPVSGPTAGAPIASSVSCRSQHSGALPAQADRQSSGGDMGAATSQLHRIVKPIVHGGPKDSEDDARVGPGGQRGVLGGDPLPLAAVPAGPRLHTKGSNESDEGVSSHPVAVSTVPATAPGGGGPPETIRRGRFIVYQEGGVPKGGRSTPLTSPSHAGSASSKASLPTTPSRIPLRLPDEAYKPPPVIESSGLPASILSAPTTMLSNSQQEGATAAFSRSPMPPAVPSPGPISPASPLSTSLGSPAALDQVETPPDHQELPESGAPAPGRFSPTSFPMMCFLRDAAACVIPPTQASHLPPPVEPSVPSAREASLKADDFLEPSDARGNFCAGESSAAGASHGVAHMLVHQVDPHEEAQEAERGQDKGMPSMEDESASTGPLALAGPTGLPILEPTFPALPLLAVQGDPSLSFPWQRCLHQVDQTPLISADYLSPRSFWSRLVGSAPIGDDVSHIPPSTALSTEGTETADAAHQEEMGSEDVLPTADQVDFPRRPVAVAAQRFLNEGRGSSVRTSRDGGRESPGWTSKSNTPRSGMMVPDVAPGRASRKGSVTGSVGSPGLGVPGSPGRFTSGSPIPAGRSNDNAWVVE